MTEVQQITIPDFDDEEFNSSSIPFGRSAGHFGFGFNHSSGGSGGADSPTISFPTNGERDVFHSRGDSNASEDSSLSFSHTTSQSHATSTRPNTPSSLAHSSQTSVTTPSPFTKKPSFASLRNAFKSAGGKSASSSTTAFDAPPVPHLDRQAYPALRNPFSRSTSALAHTPQSTHTFTPAPAMRRPSVSTSAATSPPKPHSSNRPSTPGSSSADHRLGQSHTHTRALSSRSRGQRSQNSHSGSLFQVSDHGHEITTPPMPRVPFGRNETPPLSDGEDKVSVDPRTPSEFALHAVFMSFAQTAEAKIEDFLKEPSERDPQLVEFFGPGRDAQFDALLQSLARIATKNAKPVIDSILRWRKSQQESVSEEIIQHQLRRWGAVSMQRHSEIVRTLNERKDITAIYIMCRALIAVVQILPKDALKEPAGLNLEEMTFDQFRRPDLKLLGVCGNHRSNAELFAMLLGKLSNLRFESVTDRFLNELKPVRLGQVPKELELKYEVIVKGLRHIQLRVWPPESFEEGAEFLESLSKSFERAHGLRLKSTFAETLIQLLHPMRKTAQAEVNHPVWAKAIETIYPKAREMMNKPRYWQVAYPLVITTLCVAPHDFFLKNWMSCFELGLVKLKEKPYRMIVMNGMLRLIWTYLYRCQESVANTTTRLDGILKHFFPGTRANIYPPDDSLAPLVYIVHFILSRHFDFGRELALTLIQEQPIRQAVQAQSNITHLLAPERTQIALEATLMSLNLVEKEQPHPTWPSSCDFTSLPPNEDYQTNSDFCPPSFMSKPGMGEFFERCGTTVGVIATACAKNVGRMSIFDEQYSLAKVNNTYDELSNFVVRHHNEGSVAYPANLASQINLLHTCFSSWPRCLYPSLSMNDAIDMLIRGIIHVEPAVGEAASDALMRIAGDPQHLRILVSRFSSFLFAPKRMSNETSGTRLPFESTRLLTKWYEIVELWANTVMMDDSFHKTEDGLNTQFLNIQAATLFLLSSEGRSARQISVKLVKMLQGVVQHYRRQPISPLDEATENAFRLMDTLTSVDSAQPFFDDLNEDPLDSSQYPATSSWRKSKLASSLLQVAESESQKDRIIWRSVYPLVIRANMQSNVMVLTLCRDAWIAATLRYHGTIINVAGIKNTSQASQNGRLPTVNVRDREKLIDEYRLTIDQWHVWVKLVCCTASAHVDISGVNQHSRSPSEIMHDKELSMTSTRCLFRHLTPFLDSEHSVFRDAAVSCISSFPAEAYKGLLEDLGSFASRHCYVDTARSQMSPVSGRRNRRQDKLYLAVAHIYQLTAHHLKDQRGMARQDSLTNILKFVRHTQAFLSSPDIRKDWQQQQLRRYFCGIVERVFDGLATLQSSDRFIPPSMHLTLYRLCEEWCQCGTQSEKVKQRLISMQTDVVLGYVDPQQKGTAVERFQTETRLLSHAAVGAMASLCQKALFPPEIPGSPPDRIFADFLAPLDVSSTLDRIIAMLASIHEPVKAGGRKALRSLVEYKGSDDMFVSEVIRRSFVTSKESDTSNTRFFEVVSSVIINSQSTRFSFAHVVCLCLTNLCSQLVETRRQALRALDAVHSRQGDRPMLSQFEAGISSSASNVYLGTQTQLSTMLAQQHTDDAVHVIVQVSSQLPPMHDILPAYIFSHVLQSVSPWLSTMQITETDNSTLSKDGRVVLYHLLSLTLRFSETFPVQLQILWAGLVDEQPSNGHATTRFLLEQSSKVGSAGFIACARKIVACLSRTSFGRQVFDELCEVIEPARMLPTMDHKFTLPDADEADLWSDLDALFAEQPRCVLGAGQFALLFLADVAPSRAWERKKQIPILLHGIFTHIGHRITYIREQTRAMLFQVLRAWLPGFDDLLEDSEGLSPLTWKAALADLEGEGSNVFWSEEDPNTVICSKMAHLCSVVLQLLNPLHPTLADEWGSVSLIWGTSCSIRAIAFRSLQIFRALLPRITQADLAQLLGRLSNTIAAPETNIQSFAVELILTLGSVASSGNVDSSLLPTMYWCALACLSTPVEIEFLQLIELVNCLLDKLDLNDAYTEEVLLAHKPDDWGASSVGLQSLLLVGMRSIKTYAPTFKLIRRLTGYRNSQLIASPKDRVRDVYTLILPWCLRAMEIESCDEALIEFANQIAELAEEEERPSIARIMTSFAKSRFRTKDDFMRQAASALREYYAPHEWTEVVTLLLSLVLNQEQWLQVKSMQFLKVLFQLRETRQPVDRLGSELLMPLLRLLNTDLAAQALEVLEEPMTISGGLPARQVLRLSMHIAAPPQRSFDAVTEVFGVPEPSGWCIPRHDRQREICRVNVMAVFDTCKMPTRPSQIDFEPEIERFVDPLEADLGDLVQNLHELSTYFQETQATISSSPSSTTSPVGLLVPLPKPNHQLEARVAAILAKSTDATIAADSPQTPFVDVFSVGATNGDAHGFDDSDDDSDSSEFDADRFAYDHPTSKDLQAFQANGLRDYQYPRRF